MGLKTRKTIAKILLVCMILSLLTVLSSVIFQKTSEKHVPVPPTVNYEVIETEYEISEQSQPDKSSQSTLQLVEASCEESVSEPSPVTNEVTYLAKLVWGEARGCAEEDKESVVWCVLNRLREGSYGNSVEAVITAPYQFVGYTYSNPVTDEILVIVNNVLAAWQSEQDGSISPKRTIPQDYLWFHGDGTRNYFRNAYEGGNVISF